jgi:hypothetical protein
MIMNQPTQLSLEKEFDLKSFAYQVQSMSHEQTQEFLLMLYREMLIRETIYQQILQHEWNIPSSSVSNQD